MAESVWKDRFYLLDAPLASSSLFGHAVNTVVNRFKEARKQAAEFQRFPPHSSWSLKLLGATHQQKGRVLR